MLSLSEVPAGPGLYVSVGHLADEAARPMERDRRSFKGPASALRQVP